MHPNPIVQWQDREAMRELVRAVSFGMLFAGTPDGPRVAHLPAVWLGDDAIGVHVARGNGLTRHLDGATALFVVNGPDGYVSPDWYGLGPDEVPTWNYVAVELEGVMRRMTRDEMMAQIDQLGAEQETRLAPKPAWTRDKADAGKIAKMADGIVGFKLDIQGWRGTLKLSQNKSEAARLAAADGLASAGRTAIAHMMRSL